MNIELGPARGYALKFKTWKWDVGIESSDAHFYRQLLLASTFFFYTVCPLLVYFLLEYTNDRSESEMNYIK